MDDASSINVNATDNGDGGHIVIWSDGQTTAQGTLSAKGGANGGNGGLIETSGHSVDFTGIRIDASAAHGTGGAWLVDPTDLTIDATAAATIDNALNNGTGVTLLTNADGTTSAGLGNTSPGNGDINIDAAISASSQAAALKLEASNNININASVTGNPLTFVMQAGGSVNINNSVAVSALTIVAQGNIIVGSGTGQFSAGGMTLTAAGDINIATNGANSYFGTNPTIASGGSVSINGGAAGGASVGGFTVTAYDNINIYGGFINTNGGTINLHADSFGAANNTANSPVTGTVSLASLSAGGAAVNIFYYPVSGNYGSPTSYASSVFGASSLTAYMLVNGASDLQAINNNLGGTYALAADINAGATNLTPIGYFGSNNVTPFTGLFDGQDHVITVAVTATGSYGGPAGQPGLQYGSGLFEMNSGTIRNVGVAGGFTDNYNLTVGPLVAINNGTVTNSFSTADVFSNLATGGGSTTAYLGGLVGTNGTAGTINASYATGRVSGSSSAFAGGLVGQNRGTVENSYATGNVSAATAGGLVGENFADVTNGRGGFIDYTYALGSVSGIAGGLVGQNDWSLCSCSGGSVYATIENSYAAGHVIGSSAGGLVGNNQFDTNGGQNIGSAQVFWSIWNADTTQTTNPFGIYYGTSNSSNLVQYIGFVSTNSGKTSASGAANLGNPYSISSYTGGQQIFNDPTPGSTNIQNTGFAGHWYMINGSTMPFLTAEWSTTIQNSHQLQLIDMNPTATYTLARDITYANDGMWSAGFSPIAPQILYNVETQVFYTTNILVSSPTLASYNQTISGNLVLNVYHDDIPGPPYTFNIYNNTLVSQNFSAVYQPAPFNGTLNGNGHTITGLTVNTGGNANAGLFDTIGTGGAVQNLGIVNGTFFNNVAPNSNSGDSSGAAGTIAGINYGIITNSWALSTTDSLAQPTVYGFNYAGGLVGANVGTISQSYAAVTVAGVNQDTTSGAQPYGAYYTFNDNDGGLVGLNLGKILNSYATGNVEGNGAVGGLVGTNSNTGTIQNTYATGQLFANYNFTVNSAGPLVGTNSGSVTGSYWNSDSWNATLASTGAPHQFNYYNLTTSAGAGLTTAQMQDLNSFEANYSGWDFTRIWAPPNQAGQGGLPAAYYPQLYADSYVMALWGNGAMTYGSFVPPLTATMTGLRSYDPTSTIAYSLTTSATSSSNVGPYAITITTPYQEIVYNGTLPGSITQIVGSQAPDLNYIHNYEASYNGLPLVINGVQFNSCNSASCTTASIVNAFNAALSGVGIVTTLSPSGDLVLTSTKGPITITDTVGLTGLLNGHTYDMFGLSPGTVNAAANAPSGRDGNNYRVIDVPGTLTVTPASLTITANGDTKTYGQTAVNGSAGYASSGLVNGDSISSVSFSSTGLAANATVDGGPYAITPSNAQGTGLGNYNITYVNGTLTINPATLTYTANAANMTYGGTVPTLGGSVTGFVNNETLSGATTGALTWSTNATSSSNVGSYYINGSGLTANHGDYTFVQAAGNATAMTINPATLVVTPEAVLMTYSGVALNNTAYSDALGNYGITGYVNGQNATSAGVSLSGSMAFNGSSGTSVLNAGTYSQAQGSLALISANSNYVMQFTNSAPNNYVISPATLTVTPNAVATNYSGVALNNATYSDTLGNYNITGYVNGQNATSAGVSLSGSMAFNGSTGTSVLNAGTYSQAQGGLALTSANSNYVMQFANATPNNYVITPAVLTLAGTKTYDGTTAFAASTFGSGGTINTGINGETLVLSGSGTVASPNVSAGTQALTLSTLTLTNGIGLASNYQIATSGNTGTVDPAQITVTANGGTSTYGQSPGNPGLSATGLQNGETASVLTGLSNSFGITNLTNVGSYTLSVAGKLANSNYTITQRNTGTWVVDPATLTYVADPSIQTFGVAFPTFTGTVTGFVNGETQASATTGTLQFTSPATPQSSPGIYGIYGSGLTANHGNYVFTQAPGNDTALTLNPAPNSHLPTTPPLPTPNNQVSINFSNPGTNVARVSFTPNGPNTANNQGNDVNPASLPPGEAFMHNHGLYFPPISQYDANQYSDFKAPPYDNDDSEATILTIIARGVAQTEAAKYMIDGFWNGSEDTWPGATHVDLLGKATFSDGAGHDVTPTNDTAFPIVAGKTDFAAFLMNGPVMIGGPAGQTPPQWLLAVTMTPDGKGIICDDPQTGGLVELAYDPATKTIGGITGVFDAKTKGFVALADAGNDIPASDVSGLAGLQTFVPSTYYAVTVH